MKPYRVSPRWYPVFLQCEDIGRYRMEEKILEVREITKRYPGVVALDRLSFDLEKGEVHAIVGENGAGKSTLIKCLCGAVVPEEGTITIEGKDYSEMNPALSRSLGIEVVYQELNLIDGLTVAENVCFGAKYGKLVNFRLLEEKTKKVFDELNVSINPRKLVLELFHKVIMKTFPQ